MVPLFLLHLLTSSPPLFFLEDSSLKEVSCHQLGMWVLTVPDYMLFDVFPRPTSHQIPGLGVWARLHPLPLPTHTHTHSEARKVNLPCIVDMKGWWGLLFSCVLMGSKNCQNLSVVVESSCVHLGRGWELLYLKDSRNLRSCSPLPMEISTLIRFRSEAHLVFVRLGIGILL